MSTIDSEQPDLTDHVFRSVRGWLHRLFPADTILLEPRTEEALHSSGDAVPPPSSARPLWRQQIIAGPTFEDHTGYSHKTSLVIELLRACPTRQDAITTAGRVLANASRPGGRIQLYAYNLPFPQLPSITVGESPDEVDLPETLAVSVVAVGASGGLASAPSPVVVVAPGGLPVAVTPTNWPAGAPLATSFRIYAGAADGDGLTLQASIPAGGTAVLTALGAGSPIHEVTNVCTEMLGLRVDAVSAEPEMAPTNGPPGVSWDMRARLTLTVQTPMAFSAHLADQLLP